MDDTGLTHRQFEPELVQVWSYEQQSVRLRARPVGFCLILAVGLLALARPLVELDGALVDMDGRCRLLSKRNRALRDVDLRLS